MTTSTSETGSLWSALRSRNYRLYVSGQLVSLIGTWTQNIALSWLVYRITGSAFWLGIVSFCTQGPSFLFAPLGGALADHYRRRTILVLTQSSAMLLAFVLAALTMTGRVHVVHILILSALGGIIFAVDSPTRQSFVLEMVGRAQLPVAIRINTSLVMCASFVGPAIGGVAIKAIGEGWCFVVNGVSFFAVIGGLLAMRGLAPASPSATRESMRARLTGGFRFAATHAEVRALLALLAVTALTGLPFGTLMPVFASKILHGDSRTLGILMGAPGLGATCAGLLFRSTAHSEKTFLRNGIAAAIFGLSLVGLGLSHSLWVAVAILLPAGVATMVQFTSTNSLIQSLTPDALRGRVMSIWTMIFMGFVPIGALLSGSLASTFGPRAPLVGGGIVCALGGVGFARWVLSTHPAADQCV